MSTVFVGLARAAFEEALKYSKERVEGGKPISDHQLIKKKLFDMFTKIETARSYSKDMFRYLWKKFSSSSLDLSFRHPLAAQVYSTQIAYEVSDEAIQIHGGYGLTKDYIVEKLYREARASLIEMGPMRY